MPPKTFPGLVAPGAPTQSTPEPSAAAAQPEYPRAANPPIFTGPDPASLLQQRAATTDFTPPPIQKARMKITGAKAMRKYENGTVNWDKAIFKGPSLEPTAAQKAAYHAEKAKRENREREEARKERRRVREEKRRVKEEKRIELVLGHVLRRWKGNETFERYEGERRT